MVSIHTHVFAKVVYNSKPTVFSLLLRDLAFSTVKSVSEVILTSLALNYMRNSRREECHCDDPSLWTSVSAKFSAPSFTETKVDSESSPSLDFFLELSPRAHTERVRRHAPTLSAEGSDL